jgi:hypothetical protein
VIRRMTFARSIDVLIRSYYRDFRWLRLALRSLEQFVSGYRRAIVVVPQASLARLDIPIPSRGTNVIVRTCSDYADDYLGQQVTKLHADLYTDADIIFHLDSDQIFVARCDLSERLFEGGKLKMVFDRSGRRPVHDGWRHCPEYFFGRAFLWDLATPLPLAIPRHVYGGLRAYCVENYGKSIADYALATKPDRFCEVALLRGFAMLQEAGAYRWVNAEYGDLVPECRTFWSRSTAPPAIAGSLPACLSEYV